MGTEVHFGLGSRVVWILKPRLRSPLKHPDVDFEDVERSIVLILRTSPGERLNQPDFGCRIHELAFVPRNESTLRLMELYVVEALSRWEPRIEIDCITTDNDPNRGAVLIGISYRLKSSRETRNFVYPYVLIESS